MRQQAQYQNLEENGDHVTTSSIPQNGRNEKKTFEN